MMDTKRNVLLGLITLILLGASIFACLLVSKGKGTYAIIYQNGEEIERINLTTVTEGYTLTITTEDGGVNILTIESDGVSMLEANCPDGLCMATGKLTGGRIPIVCLPNHLIVQLTGDEEEDSNEQAVDAQAY